MLVENDIFDDVRFAVTELLAKPAKAWVILETKLKEERDTNEHNRRSITT